MNKWQDEAIREVMKNPNIQMVPKNPQGAVDMGLHPCPYCPLCLLGWDDDCQDDCKYLKRYYEDDNG